MLLRELDVVVTTPDRDTLPLAGGGDGVVWFVEADCDRELFEPFELPELSEVLFADEEDDC